MTSDSDGALSWEGDEPASPRPPKLPAGWNAVGKGSDSVEQVDGAASDRASAERGEHSTGASTDSQSVADADAADVHGESAGLSTASLLGLGVLGGIYLLYTIGWIVGGLRLQPLARFLVADAMYLPWFVLAIAAPALWFLASWMLTRGKAGWMRMLALIGGAVLLVPWPFVMVGVMGS